MPAGSDVRPQRWENMLDLYDDGEFSAVWGTYDNSPPRRLGVRWNGESNVGYPNQGEHPLWYVLPDWLEKMILLGFCDKIAKNPSEKNKKNIDNILTALKECPLR